MKSAAKSAVIYSSIMFFLAIIIVGITFLSVSGQSFVGTPEKTTAKTFVVRSYNGKIAVYKSDRKTPEKVLDIYVKTLPIKDREMLEKGIIAKNEREVDVILQDYDG